MENIKKSVGNFMDNDEGDVPGVKKALNEIGFRDAPLDNGIIERETDDAIKKFQKEKGLKIDGFLSPGGETEKELRREVFKQRILLAAAEGGIPQRVVKVIKKGNKIHEFGKGLSERSQKRTEEEDKRRQDLLDNDDPKHASELAKQKSEDLPNALADIKDSALSTTPEFFKLFLKYFNNRGVDEPNSYSK